jgi:hypothetical protein
LAAATSRSRKASSSAHILATAESWPLNVIQMSIGTKHAALR